MVQPAQALAPAQVAEQNVRPLPLRSDSDPLADVVRGDNVDGVALDELLLDHGKRLGIDGLIGYLWTMETGSPATEASGTAIPYSYPTLEGWVAMSLDHSAAKAQPSLVVDLSAALIVAEAHDLHSHGLALAQVLLEETVPDTNSCDVKLQRLYAYSVGGNPPLADLKGMMSDVAVACPGDPTPRWILGQLGARLALDEWSEQQTSGIAVADEQFAKLQEEHAASPLGFAGAADLLLDRADWVERRGNRPFQARSWREEALGLYEHARTISSDPGLLPGHVRALVKLGRLDAAGEVLKLFPAKMATRHDAAVAAVLYQQQRHDWAAVITTVTSTSGQDPLVVQGPMAERSPAYGRSGSEWEGLWDASSTGSGGADALDVAFIPAYRGSYATTGCFDRDLLDAVLLSGQLPHEATSHVESLPGSVRCMETAEVQHQESKSGADLDRAQDLHRWAGDLEGAEAALDRWESEWPRDYAVWQRRGELAYLRGDYVEAASLFQRAGELIDEQLQAGVEDTELESLVDTSQSNVHPPVMVAVQESAARVAAGEVAQAIRILESAAELYTGEESAPDAERFYVASQLGAIALAKEDYSAAAAHYLDALHFGQYGPTSEFIPSPDQAEDVPGALLRGAQENNLALALSKLERHDEAVEASRAAVSRDARNPIYLDTLAFTLQRAGAVEEAAALYREVLGQDSTSFVTANNFAVLLADAGDDDEAYELLHEALNTQPGYAVAWHNLGVVALKRDPSALVESEQALAMAARLDRSLRGELAQLQFDDAVYASGLDISKPVAPEWSFASSVSLPHRFTWLMMGMLLVQVGWVMGLERVVEHLGTRWFGRLDGVSKSGLRRLSAPVAISLAAAAAVLGLTAVVGSGSWTRGALYSLASVAMVALPWGVRALAGGGRILHRASAPAIALGVLGVPLGLGFAPMPGVLPRPGGGASTRVLWSASSIVAGMAGIFGVLAAITGAPGARIVAVGAVSLLGAMMLPFTPFDGVWLRKRQALVIAAGLGVASLVLGMQWV